MKSWIDHIDHWLLPVLFVAFIYLSFNLHSKAPYNSYQHVIWADAAGYHMYQPGLFLYGFEQENFPEQSVEMAGNGFYFHEKTDRAVTKYTYGVSLLQVPFFLIAHGAAKVAGEKADGYSRFYHWAIIFASAFYALLGLLILRKFLKRHFSTSITVLTLLFLVAGTNLYYYVVDSGGMSHVYSFFLFALVLYYLDRFYETSTWRNLLGVVVPLGLAIIIRPTAAIMLLFVFLYNVKSLKELSERLLFWVRRWPQVVVSAAVIVLFWVPHLIYNHYVTGEWLLWSYQDEGFIYAAAPKFQEVFAAAKSGMLTYVPMMGVLILAMLLMTIRRQCNAWLIFLVFLVTTYLFASWHSWYFGCSFGQRSYVEYLTLFAIPLAWLLKKAFASKKLYGYALLLVLTGCTIWSMKLVYIYDGCYYGDPWDFAPFWEYFN